MECSRRSTQGSILARSAIAVIPARATPPFRSARPPPASVIARFRGSGQCRLFRQTVLPLAQRAPRLSRRRRTSAGFHGGRKGRNPRPWIRAFQPRTGRLCGPLQRGLPTQPCQEPQGRAERSGPPARHHRGGHASGDDGRSARLKTVSSWARLRGRRDTGLLHCVRLFFVILRRA